MSVTATSTPTPTLRLSASTRPTAIFTRLCGRASPDSRGWFTTASAMTPAPTKVQVTWSCCDARWDGSYEISESSGSRGSAPGLARGGHRGIAVGRLLDGQRDLLVLSALGQRVGLRALAA